MEYDVFLLGPVSIDSETGPGTPYRKFVGGSVMFASYASIGMGHNVFLLTKMARDDWYVLEPFAVQGMQVLESKATTSMCAAYTTEDRESRELKVNAMVDPITPEELPDIKAKIYQMAGMYFGEFDTGLFEELAKRGPLAFDIQCFTRYEENGVMVYRDWAEKKKYLPYVTYLKADANEAQILTGKSDRREAAKILHSYGAKEVMITHNTEVIVYDGKDMYCVPIKAENTSGRTGRGDTVFSGYITERLHHNIPDSLLVATALVSLKIETPGPFRGRRADVETFLQDHY